MTVTRFEADLLKLTRFLLGHVPPQQAHLALHQRQPVPPGLSPNAVALLQDTLRKGLVEFLVRGGGWRQCRFLKDGTAAAGHPWQRIPAELRQLQFSRLPQAFLLWLTAERPSDAREAWPSKGLVVTLADQIFFLLAARSLQAFPEQWLALRRSTPFAGNPWVWLAMPAALDDDSIVPDFHTLLKVPGPAMLECLQDWLGERWIAADALKAGADWETLVPCGLREDAAINGFLQAASHAGRRDLARFLLKAIAKRTSTTLTDWTAAVPEVATVSLANRLAAKRAALSLMCAMEVFERWTREAQQVNFFESDYAASQLWKADYEAANGSQLAENTRGLLRQIDPLTTTR